MNRLFPRLLQFVLILFTVSSCNSVKGVFPLKPIHTLVSASKTEYIHTCHGSNNYAVSTLANFNYTALPALLNLGHTCYLNSVLQSLYYSPYRQAVLSIPIGDGVKRVEVEVGNHCHNLTFKLHSTGYVLHKLFRQFSESLADERGDEQTILSPGELISTMGLELGYQEDAHEFMLNLIQQVDASLEWREPGSEISEDMLPSAVIKGRTQHSVECIDVNHKRHHVNAFVTLGVDVPYRSEKERNIINSEAANHADDMQDDQPWNLLALLNRSLLSEEYLSGDNRLRVEMPEAPSGETGSEDAPNPIISYHDAIMRERLMTPLPDVLYIHFNRFTYDREARRVIKVVVLWVVLHSQLLSSLIPQYIPYLLSF